MKRILVGGTRAARWTVTVVIALSLFGAFATAVSVVDAPTAGAVLGAPLTSAFIDSEPGDPAAGGQQLTFTTVTDISQTLFGISGSITFSLSGGGHSGQLTLAAPLGELLTVGTYEGAQGSPRVAGHALVSVLAGGTCQLGTGRFMVDEITTNGGGQLLTFSARFEQHCNGTDAALFGAVSYNATADYRTITISPSSLTFAPRPNNNQPSPYQTITLTNHGPSPLNISRMGWDSSSGFGWNNNTCEWFGSTLASGQSCSIDINFTAEGAAGLRTGKITFFDDLSPEGGGGTGRDVVLTGEVLNVGATGWEALGGQVNADPAVASDASGVYAFVRGGDLGVYYRKYANGTWSSYAPLGGFLSSLPWAVADPDGTSGIAGIHVFGRGLDGALYTGHLTNGVWSGWQPLGGFLTSFPTAVTGPNGIDVAVRGGDGALYVRHLSGGTWGPYQALGGVVQPGVWLVSHPSGTYAFATGGDSSLYWRSLTGGTWQALGGVLTSPPIAIRDAAGISVFVRGGDGAVYLKQWNGSVWTPYQALGGYITSVPTAVADSVGVSLFARGGDGALWQRRFENGSWAPWKSLGGYMISDAILTAVGSVDHVFVIGYDNGLYTRRLTFDPGITSAGAGEPGAEPRPGLAGALRGDGLTRWGVSG